MTAPRGVAVVPDGNTAYVAETGNNRISVWNLTANTATTVKPSCGGTGLAQPWGITWDPEQDVALHRRREERAGGSHGTRPRNVCQVVVTSNDLPPQYQMLGSNFIEFDSNGLMYVSDNARHIYVFQVTG